LDGIESDEHGYSLHKQRCSCGKEQDHKHDPIKEKPTKPTSQPSIPLSMGASCVAAPVNSRGAVCCTGAALALLGTKKPAAMVTTGAGGGRSSVEAAGADAIGVVEATEDETARDVPDALDKAEEAGLAELDMLKVGMNDEDGDEDGACVVDSIDDSAEDMVTTTEDWLAVLEATDVALLVTASDVRGAELEVSAADDVLSEAVTVISAVTLEVT